MQRREAFSLCPEFKAERQVERFKQQNREDSLYIYPHLQAMYQVEFSNNLLVNFIHRGVLHGKYMFVRDYATGFTYVAQEDGIDAIAHHSYLSNGKKVSSAGYLHINNGILTMITNESGHYKPTNHGMLGDLEFYSLQSGNPGLLYEDHSQQKDTKQIFQYLVTDVIACQDNAHNINQIPVMNARVGDSRHNKRFNSTNFSSVVANNHNLLFANKDTVSQTSRSQNNYKANVDFLNNSMKSQNNSKLSTTEQIADHLVEKILPDEMLTLIHNNTGMHDEIILNDDFLLEDNFKNDLGEEISFNQYRS